jgi:hypothetical protein
MRRVSLVAPLEAKLLASTSIVAVALLGALSASCFSPELGPAPFICSATQPQCPESYLCVNGVCLDKDSVLDAGTPPPDVSLPDGVIIPDTMPGDPVVGPDLPSNCGASDYACRTCAAAQALPEPPMMASVITLTGTTSGSGGFAGSCSTMQGAEAESPEVVYVVNLPFRARLEADTRGSSFDTLLYLRTACSVGSGDLKCSDDISTDPLAPEVQSSFSADLEIGQYFLFVDGFNRQEQGAYNLNVKLTPL